MLLPTVVFLLTVNGAVQGICIEPLEEAQLPAGFTAHKVMRTWNEAKLHCEKEGAVLASPITTEVLNAMISVIGANNTSYFIGTKSTQFSGAYTSVEGVPLEDMTAAVTRMIQQLNPHHGDCLSMDLDSIRVVPCTVRLPFMCYTAVEESNDSGRDKCNIHSGGYKYYERTGSCYKVHGEYSMTYDKALATCEAEGGHLAVIDDDNEAEVIYQINLESGSTQKYLGLHDDSGHGDWRSVTGKPVTEIYNVWQFGGPKGSEWFKLYCAVLLPSGVLDDSDCDVERQFICEI